MLKLAKKTILGAIACLFAFCIIAPGIAQASEYANVPSTLMEINSQNLAVETILGTAESGINSQSLAQSNIKCVGYYDKECKQPTKEYTSAEPVCKIAGVVMYYCPSESSACLPCPK
ncbi:MAG: hypothetical protein SXA11_25075 [Cyanobacteriota bacterium]|nr:hypothetical protein [Cyanobacteriota bacterium]